MEDQLWAMTQTVNVPKQIRDLWPSHHLRQHTALGRLNTMICFQDSEQPIKLAELGLMNTSDKQKKLSHFQDIATPLESVFGPNLENSIEK